MLPESTAAQPLRPPANWHTGYKTGTGRMAGTTNKCNDVAIANALGKNPIIIAAYFDSAEHTQKIEARDVAVLAQWAVR